MTTLFGTDGVRGVANRDLTPELVYRLGRAAAIQLSPGVSRPRILVGRDTRISGDLLEAALVSGILSAGADVLAVGVVSTPGIAFLTRHMNAAGGAVISASHNPVEDNGLKLFSRNGHKLTVEAETAVSDLALRERDDLPRPTGAGVGRLHPAPALVEQYLDYLVRSTPVRLDGMRIVVDAGNGATYRLAPELLERVGARVTLLNADPDGLNINVGCGSTHPAGLMQAVRETGAVAGIAYDGDGDRAIAADEHGREVDGDQILAACGLHLLDQDRLPGRAIVGTVMTNLGLEVAFRSAGGRVLRTPVGDRHILEAMVREELVLGGEQSGHIIFLDAATTGDGLLTTLRLLAVMVESGWPLSRLAARMVKYPQILVNVPARPVDSLESNAGLARMVGAARGRLGPNGRVVLRPSGTEPVVRVMAEGEDSELVETVAREIAAYIAREFGGPGA
ncbi:MAG TPA: phosphoglucosamine mutase [Clostridiales bacterium]|nr:phosphoglucosamine mutase [Clostridiales bacterium]